MIVLVLLALLLLFVITIVAKSIRVVPQAYTGIVEREVADDVFLEAMAASGVAAWRRYPMYWAVRACGGSRYKRRSTVATAARR